MFKLKVCNYTTLLQLNTFSGHYVFNYNIPHYFCIIILLRITVNTNQWNILNYIIIYIRVNTLIYEINLSAYQI